MFTQTLQAPLFAVVSYSQGVALVLVLLAQWYPDTVTGLITLVHINTLYCHTFRVGAHVTAKIAEIKPLVA